MLLEAPDHDLDTLLKTHHIPMPDIPARKSPSDLDADVESRRGNFAHSMSQSLLVIIDLLRGVRRDSMSHVAVLVRALVLGPWLG